MTGAFTLATAAVLFITFIVWCCIRAGARADEEFDQREFEETMGRIVKRINERKE